MTKDREITAEWIEEILFLGHRIAEDIRTGNNTASPYALVYWLRKELGALVASRGAGAPSSLLMRAISKEYFPLLEAAKKGK